MPRWSAWDLRKRRYWRDPVQPSMQKGISAGMVKMRSMRLHHGRMCQAATTSQSMHDPASRLAALLMVALHSWQADGHVGCNGEVEARVPAGFGQAQTLCSGPAGEQGAEAHPRRMLRPLRHAMGPPLLLASGCIVAM